MWKLLCKKFFKLPRFPAMPRNLNSSITHHRTRVCGFQRMPSFGDIVATTCVGRVIGFNQVLVTSKRVLHFDCNDTFRVSKPSLAHTGFPILKLVYHWLPAGLTINWYFCYLALACHFTSPPVFPPVYYLKWNRIVFQHWTNKQWPGGVNFAWSSSVLTGICQAIHM